MNVQELRLFYEQETGLPWDADLGILWLSKNREKLELLHERTIRLPSAFLSLSEKAGWVSQQYCRVCGTSYPIISIPIRIQPESWQALDSINKRAFKEAIANHLAEKDSNEFKDKRICLTLLFVCGSRRTKDLDNMAKLFMDSIKGIIMDDDKFVDHLNLLRLTHDGDEEYIVLQISESQLNDHSDTVYPHLRHSWAGQNELKIEDFIVKP